MVNKKAAVNSCVTSRPDTANEIEFKITMLKLS